MRAKRHPAIPKEATGYTLHQIKKANRSSKIGRWRAGYIGNEAPRQITLYDTEAEAVDWILRHYDGLRRAAWGQDIVSGFLCRAWV